MGTLIFDIKQIMNKKTCLCLGAWNLQMEKGEQKDFYFTRKI
jgi:hypothetical protein